MPKDWNGNKASTFKCLGASSHTEHARAEFDYYATDPISSELLLEVEPDLDNIWEPAVGEKHLANVFEKAGKLGRMSDIVNRTDDDRVEIIDFLAKPSGLLAKKEVWNGDIVTNPPYACYDKETQVKTKDGWRYFYELTGNEEILSVNPENLKLEWSKIVTRHEYDYNGNMVHFKNRLQDLMVTPNHRMFCFHERLLSKYNSLVLQCDKQGNVFTASGVNSSSITPKFGYSWQGVDKDCFILDGCQKTIGKNATIELPSLMININDWLRFFGFWLADGFCGHTLNSKGHQRYTVGIKQDVKTFEETKQIFEALPFKYVIKKDKNFEQYSFTIENKQLWLYLSQFGYSRDKYVPQFIKELPSDKLQLFLDSYLFGDSTKLDIGTDKHKIKTIGCRISSVSKQMIEDFHEIALKLGYLSSSICFCEKKTCRLYYFNYYKTKKQQQNNIKYKSKTLVPYNDKVYCVTLEKNGFMLVRRNDKYCFSGNSALEFVKRALELVPNGRKVCMFLKLTFLEGKERKQFFLKNPPKTIYVSSSRITCAMNGEFYKPKLDKKGNEVLGADGKPIMEKQSSAVCYMWAVWEKGFKGDPIIKWIN